MCACQSPHPHDWCVCVCHRDRLEVLTVVRLIGLALVQATSLSQHGRDALEAATP